MPVLSVQGAFASLRVESNGSYLGTVYPDTPLYVSSALPLTISVVLTNRQAVLDGVELAGTPLPMPWHISLIADTTIVVWTHVVVPITLPTTPPPANTGTGDGERVGYCTLKAYQSFGQTWYDVIHDDGSKIASGERYETAKRKADSYEECKRAPAPVAGPAPAGISQAQLDTAIATAQAQNVITVQNGMRMLLDVINITAEMVVQAAQSAAEDLFASLERKLDVALMRLETDLIDPIRTGVAGLQTGLGDLWTAAGEIVQHAEEEAAAWREGVLDLEGSLKAWIEAKIIGIIWRALTAEQKEEA